MITSQSPNPCSECRVGYENHKHLQAIGDEVRLPGVFTTGLKFSQCHNCGHVWQSMRELDFGGGSGLSKILTDPW